ncbi:DUF4433 domain-containing protein [Lactobacillus equicursoris]|uniref:DUF4433 domain-containing protein n=1 Tax=Lactobacillus equicursoris TaxID=420645 RepID=A0A844FN98_9LACO|nr:DarT ssDNA thymidine ADP-ribosyltransferase family protein [Lactobacillus equicursoris]MDD6407925.1 DarT ssDNA thymidine ADP-ribosyltransferase family protein [Lactobacillus equicursoris]MST79837.1 DUF4433 domain-containing protein [Lactobacillus equicursoris]
MEESDLQKMLKSNYDQAFKKLEKSDVDQKWYKDESSNTTGLIWHFTDINNMANILYTLKIESKNNAEQQKLVINDNAAESVNIGSTKPWVHDYARFYLRPKTPTQYRNEGIYGKSDIEEYRRLYSRGELWNDHPAHLPVPVFICFGLKKFLQHGGHITKYSLAGKRISDKPQEEFDSELSHFCKNVLDIYSDKLDVESRVKQTEAIIKNDYVFSLDDIVKIYVRTPIEKLALLTMLSEHDAQYSTREQHKNRAIDRYINKITVEPSIFFSGNDDDYAGRLVTDIQKHPTIEEMYPKRVENLDKKDITEKISPLVYYRTIPEKQIEEIKIERLERRTIIVNDVNSEEKLVGVFHRPDWILIINKWKDIRYYTDLYYHDQYLKVFRNIGDNAWYRVDTKEEMTFTSDEERLLRRVEESISKKTILENKRIWKGEGEKGDCNLCYNGKKIKVHKDKNGDWININTKEKVPFNEEEQDFLELVEKEEPIKIDSDLSDYGL